METFFSTDPQIIPFKTFSPVHIITICILIITDFIILKYYKNPIRKAADKFRIILAVLLLSLEVITQVWYVAAGMWSIQNSLPLHLCRIGVFVTAAMLLTRNYRLYEISYFWSLGGALTAIITPSLGSYNFPHFYFFKFFISHNCLILAVLFFTITEHYRPLWKSVLNTILVTHTYIIPVAVLDYNFKANYLYLRENPGKNTLLGFFGPWPDYLLPLWIIGICFFIILYLPFAAIDYKNKRIP